MSRRSRITTLRWLLAARSSIPFVRGHLARDWPLIRRYFGVLVYLSLIGGGMFGALQFVGLQLTTALNVSVMNSLGAAVHRGGERCDVRRPADGRPVSSAS